MSPEAVPFETEPRAPRSRRASRRALAVGLLGVGAHLALGIDSRPVLPTADPRAASAPPSGAWARYEREVRASAPRGRYVVVDRANNRLWLRTAEEVAFEAVVSTGSGVTLVEADGAERRWTFETPAGRHRILNERPDPVWVKPDWAFVEEGLPLPRRLSERVERGTLGEWALDLGDGYMIHGTLYERLLGRAITHGCIRVGRDDLRRLEAGVRPGTPVLIF